MSEYDKDKRNLAMITYIFSLLMLGCFLVNYLKCVGDFSEIFFGFGLVFLFTSVGIWATGLVLDEISSRSGRG